jgi:hypothetical protein
MSIRIGGFTCRSQDPRRFRICRERVRRAK